MRGIEAAITFDVINALNLIDNDYGTVRSIPNQNTTIATFQTANDPTTGKPIFREAGTNRWNGDTLFSISDLASRWQAKVGLRVSF